MLAFLDLFSTNSHMLVYFSLVYRKQFIWIETTKTVKLYWRIVLIFSKL